MPFFGTRVGSVSVVGVQRPQTERMVDIAGAQQMGHMFCRTRMSSDGVSESHGYWF